MAIYKHFWVLSTHKTKTLIRSTLLISSNSLISSYATHHSSAAPETNFVLTLYSFSFSHQNGQSCNSSQPCYWWCRYFPSSTKTTTRRCPTRTGRILGKHIARSKPLPFKQFWQQTKFWPTMEQLSQQDILHFLQDHRSHSARVLETNQRKQALHRHEWTSLLA